MVLQYVVCWRRVVNELTNNSLELVTNLYKIDIVAIFEVTAKFWEGWYKFKRNGKNWNFGYNSFTVWSEVKKLKILYLFILIMHHLIQNFSGNLIMLIKRFDLGRVRDYDLKSINFYGFWFFSENCKYIGDEVDIMLWFKMGPYQISHCLDEITIFIKH